MARYIVHKHWLTGPKKGITTREPSIEKPRKGSRHRGAWGEYKVVAVEQKENR
jgi:hypothetical protein